MYQVKYALNKCNRCNLCKISPLPKKHLSNGCYVEYSSHFTVINCEQCSWGGTGCPASCWMMDTLTMHSSFCRSSKHFQKIGWHEIIWHWNPRCHPSILLFVRCNPSMPLFVRWHLSLLLFVRGSSSSVWWNIFLPWCWLNFAAKPCAIFVLEEKSLKKKKKNIFTGWCRTMEHHLAHFLCRRTYLQSSPGDYPLHQDNLA